MNALLLELFILDFGIGLYLFVKAFVVDWRGDLRIFRRMAKLKKPQADTLKRLNEFIRTHSTVKQLSIYIRFRC